MSVFFSLYICKCQHSGGKKPDQVRMEGKGKEVNFSMQQGAIMKRNPHPLWQGYKRRQGLEPGTFLQARRGEAALWLYTELLLLLKSDIVVPSGHMMNESPCVGQTGAHRLCNKQKKGFFRLWPPQFLSVFCCIFPIRKAAAYFLSINLLEWEIITKSLWSANIITWGDLPWNNSDLSLGDLLFLALRWSDNSCVSNAMPPQKRFSQKVERARVHLFIFAINPNPPFPGEKKGKQSYKASSRECIAPAKQRLFF